MTDSRKHSFDEFTGMLPLRLVVPLVLVVFILVVGLWGYVSIRRAVEAEIQGEAIRDLNLDMTRLQASLEEANRIGNTTWVQEQLAAFGADTHGLMAVLTDESDHVLASAARSHIGRPFNDVLPQALRGANVYEASSVANIRASMTGSIEAFQRGSMIVGTYPVLLGAVEGQLRPNRIGLALVARDLTGLTSQALARARQNSMQIGLGLLVLAGAASLLLHLLVTRRLARISRAADRLATGDLSVRSGVSGRDEIALLGQSFDAMVTDLEQHEAALIESEERHRSLFDHAAEGIVTMGEARLIQSINPAAQRMFGYAEEELLGKNVKILMPASYHEEHDDYVENYVQTSERKIIGIGREVVGKRKDGTTFPLELSVVDLKLTNERLFTGILRDITNRKRAEDELRHLNEHLEQLVQERTRALEDAQETLVRKERLATLGQLAGSVAHEIRNPLSVVRNAAYYLQQTAENPDEEAVKSFEEIQRGLTRADGIISELLDYARDPRTNHREFLLADAINRSFEGVTIPMNVTVDIPIPPPLAWCNGDPDQISRILTNLIVNGIQAMPDGGTLKLLCVFGEDGNKATLEVQDEGTGMTDDQLDKIFEPLFTTKTRGIGLGLALSLRYVELNNSSLTAESTLGQGSTFRLTIPIANA